MARIKTSSYWILLLVVLFLGSSVLSVGQTQARYAGGDTTVLNTVVLTDSAVVTSDCLVSGGNQIILLGELPQWQTVQVSFTLKALQPVSDLLYWYTTEGSLVSAVMEFTMIQGEGALDADGKLEMAAGSVAKVTMTIAAITEVTQNKTVDVWVLCENLASAFRVVVIPAAEEDPTEPAEGEEETTEPTEGEEETTEPTEGEEETTEPTEGEEETTEPTEGEEETTEPTEGEEETTEPTEGEEETTEPAEGEGETTEPTEGEEESITPAEDATDSGENGEENTEAVTGEGTEPETTGENTGTSGESETTPVEGTETASGEGTDMDSNTSEDGESGGDSTNTSEEDTNDSTGTPGEGDGDTTDPSEEGEGDATDPSEEGEGDATDPSEEGEGDVTDPPEEEGDTTEDPEESTGGTVEPGEGTGTDAVSQVTLKTFSAFEITATLPLSVMLSGEADSLQISLGGGEPFPAFTRYSLDGGNTYYMLYFGGFIEIHEGFEALEIAEALTWDLQMDFSRTSLATGTEITLEARGYMDGWVSGTGTAATVPVGATARSAETRILTKARTGEAEASEVAAVAETTEETTEATAAEETVAEAEATAETEPKDSSSFVVDLPVGWEACQVIYAVEFLRAGENGTVYEPVELSENSLYAILDYSSRTITIGLGEELPTAGTYRLTIKGIYEEVCFQKMQMTFFINYSTRSDAE